MESTGELEAVTMCGEIDIKEESVLTDPNWQLFEETEHIFIKEENVKLETLEDPDAHEPLQLKKEESPPQEETISPPDAVHTKKEPELQKEVEASSCGIEPRSIWPGSVPSVLPDREESKPKEEKARRGCGTTNQGVILVIFYWKALVKLETNWPID
ncbi:uncharacterized protein LOC126424754 isoform X11 [Schistocerca serialis cubense]|uniref:uncharacterized protein LOC126424754 isoform X11 n=1 Tax=Schistocerca serialis cubense TaxID=2023355 RepID=UPI00214E28C9|nr:uncharacterized protein LOC126424754 isoform X11 [Schistocerca serialis cubense]